jgi:ferritin
MEIKELVSFYINDNTETMDVTFRLSIDGDDEIRTDQIDLDVIKSFGYNLEDLRTNNILDMYSDEDDDDDDIFGDIFDDVEDFDSDEVKSFLNEYYLIFPDRLPDVDFF